MVYTTSTSKQTYSTGYVINVGFNQDGLALMKKIKEEIQTNRKISFPEMQKRIRDAKEKRRNQRKESEKLYMDTKRKGVKFFDKKGTGRIRDGKKNYE